MRKTGKDVKIEVEVGTTFYAMAVLSTVSSPTGDVGKVYTTSAVYLSDQDALQPDVRLDGVISGFSITPGSANNSVDVAAGTCYVKGTLVSVIATTVTGLLRPTAAGQVRVTSLTVDSDGNVNIRRGAAGTTSTTRGAAGAVPYLPVDEVLIGYITMTYYDGSASGATLVTTSEIDDETKERTVIPSYQIKYHDGSGDNPTEYGVIEFYTALAAIHGATYASGSTRRNVYASYYGATFEELGNSKDFSFDEGVGTVKSKAYGDEAEESAITTPMWSGSGTVYWEDVNDILTLIKNTKRWVKYYPDKDETPFWAGRAIVKVGRTLPLDESLSASIALEGSGELYAKQS